MMSLATIVETLDKHQGASTAVLTAALVLVTVYYAVQNSRMVAEMQRARDAGIRPKLALDFLRLGPTAMTLVIRNVGLGAALDVDVRVVWEPTADGQVLPEHRWRRNVLAPSEQADFFPPGDLNDNLNSLPATYGRVRLSGAMKDAAGNAHDVAEVFDRLPEWRAVLRDARQRFVTADPEKRAAEELHQKFNQPLQGLQRSIDGIAAAIRGLSSDKPQDEETGG